MGIRMLMIYGNVPGLIIAGELIGRIGYTGHRNDLLRARHRRRRSDRHALARALLAPRRAAQRAMTRRPGTRLALFFRMRCRHRALLDSMMRRRGVVVMTIPTEPIGSIPRPLELIEAVARTATATDPRLDALYEDAIRDTIERFEATGSPVITDGEQRKYHNFWTYPRARPAEHGARRLQDPVRGRTRPPHAAAHRAARSATSGTPTAYLDAAHALRARAGEAGGHLALGAEPDVSGRRDPRLPARGSSSTICCASTRPRSAAAWRRARTASRSTSPKGRLAVKIDPSGQPPRTASST